MRRSVALSMLLAAACGGRTRPAPGPAPLPPTGRAVIHATIDSLANDRRFANAHWGILVVDPVSGDTLYSRNAGKLFMPASNQKLLTGSTALAQLGPDFRFVTRFAATGAIRDGRLEGDLVIVGRGDPTFSDAMRGGDFRSAFRAMADSVAAHGIRRIDGSLRPGGNAFADSPYGYGWEMADTSESYGAGVDALFVNEGFRRVPAPRAAGDTTTREVPIADPTRAFLGELLLALTERGITVGTPVEPVRRAADSALRTLFILRSPPLSDVVARMAKPSQNQIAEILFKTLALEKTGVGTADSGRAVVERQLLAWGARPDGFAVRDGSGLSRHDYVTPETIIRILDAMRRSPAFRAFYDALPIAGVDGSIADRMRGTPAQGNVHAKTGTVDKARSLSGYVTTADGRLLTFSFLCNNFTVPNRDVEQVQDAILVALASTRLDGR